MERHVYEKKDAAVDSISTHCLFICRYVCNRKKSLDRGKIDQQDFTWKKVGKDTEEEKNKTAKSMTKLPCEKMKEIQEKDPTEDLTNRENCKTNCGTK